MTLLPLLLLLSAQGTALAPVPGPEDRQQALAVARMPQDSPSQRLVALLSALELDEAALYVLAGQEPLLVAELLDPELRPALEYIDSLPATERAELRAGETVVRSAEHWSRGERERLQALAELWGLDKPRKLRSVYVGDRSGRSMRLELVGARGTVYREFARAPTPAREDAALDALTARFGARPPLPTSGPGHRLPLRDGSFEEPSSLGDAWRLEVAVQRGDAMPVNDVSLDHDVSLDGASSLRLHAEDDTHLWNEVAQYVSVWDLAPGTPLLVRGLVRAQAVRLERDQERRFRVAVDFLGEGGEPLGSERLRLDQGDYDWRELALRARVPEGAAWLRLSLACTLSGTAWFDGFSIEEE